MKKESYLTLQSALKLLGSIFLITLVVGCSPAPSIVIFGASFPDWLLCSGAGILIMTALHILLHKEKYRCWLEPAGLIYPCVTALAAMLTWLLIFSN